ncbi:MAG: dihydroorotase [Clostridiales bacterium]|nr:dihydroorotase [Clostridiales bacterium]
MSIKLKLTGIKERAERAVREFLSRPENQKYNSPKYAVLPSFCDVHVHLREPGFSYKETVESGTMAAARGGYTAVCSMPNLNPVPDSVEHIQKQLDRINAGAKCAVYPYAAITVGQNGKELADMEGLAPLCAGFSDDGRGVQSEEMMKAAMLRAKALDKPIVAHCEDNSLLFGGYIHAGAYAEAHGHKGICSESEYGPIKRDIALVKQTGVSYHVCHVSAKESVEAIKKAKAEGVDITCETAPHYLVMDDSDLKEEGRFKMNPPLRGKEDRLALLEGLIDGTVDMIATDHAPHSAEEKSRGLEKSAFGIVGLETAFAVIYTHLIKTGKVSMERVIDALAIRPRERFGIPYDGGVTVFDLETEFTVNPEEFLSKGRATPFQGEKLFGVCECTYLGSEEIYRK